MSEGREVSSLGNMDLAFFVSRKELIEWVNGLLRLNITKIEQCSNGAIYIQLLDMLFPNKSVLSKAKWNVKLEYECIMNYKLIQSTFNKLGVKKYMDVDKLIKGKYQDNLEFLQWFKGFFERVIDYNNDQVINYDPIERRKIALLGEKGDYKMLNNYLPDWAKLDSNTLKERIMNNDSRSISNNHNINIVNSDNNNNNNNIYNVCKKNNQFKTNAVAYQDVSTSSVGNSLTNTTHNNNTINHNSNNNIVNRKVLKPKKKSILANTMNDSMNSSHSHKYLSTHTKKHNINTNITNTGTRLTHSGNYNISSNTNSNNNNNNSNKRSSASNKTAGRGSLSNYQTKNNTLDSRKEINLLIEQNKKLKTQLENKNQEILMFQNKLQEEECEK
ncbi:EB1 homolog, putative, partial [Hepatocystis sp. ex Piliocolobus tephrosceles]